MTTPAERDDAVERLLRGMRADAPAGSGAGCLDADTLARWADGGLSRKELADVTGHAAGCVRCQGLLAAMVRTEPPREPHAPRRFAWTLLRWGVPLTTAAALAVWLAVERDVEAPRATFQAKQTPASAPAQPAQSATDAATEARELERRRAPAPAPKPSRRERDARLERKDQSAKRDTATDNQFTPQSTRTLHDAAAAAPAPAPAPQTPPPPVTTAEESAPPLEVASRAAKQLPRPPQAVAEQIPGGGLAETVTTTATADPRTTRRARGQPQWMDVPSPDPLVRWRFSFRGDVERSVDGGLTWTRESVGGSRADLLTGVAPSSSVCWLAGQRGVVLRFTTADGWQRVSLPKSTPVVSIVATDALNATVQLAGGGTLATTDGGKTWQ